MVSVPSDTLPPFFVLSGFLLSSLRDALGSPRVFPVPVLEAPFLQGEWCVQVRTLAPGVFTLWGAVGLCCLREERARGVF